MTTKTLATPPSHHHTHNYHTGRPRFHFEEPPPSPPPSPPPAAWHDGVADDVKGFWQNKGLPLDNAKEFGVKLTELYRQAEKFIGVPPDQVLKLPKADAPPEDIRAFRERLGAPKEAKEYDLSGIEDSTIAEATRAALHARGVAKDDAAEVAKAVGAALKSKATSESTVNAAKLAEAKEALVKNWTPEKYDYNLLQANEGARRLGISPEAVKALESQIGYAAVMEAMRKIGANTREDTFVERGVGNTGEVTTREGAVARKAELMNDASFREKYLKGDATAAREMTRLNQMIVGEVA
jgi:hypothetical protein